MATYKALKTPILRGLRCEVRGIERPRKVLETLTEAYPSSRSSRKGLALCFQDLFHTRTLALRTACYRGIAFHPVVNVSPNHG